MGLPVLRMSPRRNSVRQYLPPPPLEEMRGPFPRCLGAADADEVQDLMTQLRAEPGEHLQAELVANPGHVCLTFHIVLITWT